MLDAGCWSLDNNRASCKKIDGRMSEGIGIHRRRQMSFSCLHYMHTRTFLSSFAHG